MGDHAISAGDLQACADAQNLTLKKGDILLVRSGFKVGYAALSEKEKLAWSVADPTVWVGVETSIKTARWIWETGFSACGGDAPGFERIPNLVGQGEPGGLEKLCLHEVMLSGWGMPIGESFSCVWTRGFRLTCLIGEMFDLEALSEECFKQKRYSFFLTSKPLNVVGGVGSPPNMLAIF